MSRLLYENIFITKAQLIISTVALGVLCVLTSLSILVLMKKREIANLRGQTLMSMMIVMHCLSIGYPNVLNILAYFEFYYFPSFGYFNLSTDLFALVIITNLILVRAIFMNFKARNKVVSNLRGVILTINLYIGSMYIFLTICFGPKLPFSQFQILNYSIKNVYRSAIDYKGLVVLIIFYISFLFVQDLKKWGAYQEMRGLVILRLLDMLSMGLLHLPTNNRPNWAYELQCNTYRCCLMALNCFVFLWLCDEMKKTCEMDLHMEIRKASEWNSTLMKCFILYLKSSEEDGLLEFFDSSIRDNKQVWRLLQNLAG